jgi:hypothetical protein
MADAPIDVTWPNPPCANNPTLEKRKFRTDPNDEVCVAVCVVDDETQKNDASNSFHTGMVEVDSVPGTEITVLSFTLGAGINRILTQGYISTNVIGCARLKINGTLEHSARINPSERNIYLKFDPSFPIVPGDVVSLTFESISGIAVGKINGSVSGIDC